MIVKKGGLQNGSELENYMLDFAENLTYPLPRTDRRTGTQLVGGYNIILHQFGWQGIKAKGLHKVTPI